MAQRKVHYDECIALANEFSIDYVETSALTRENVDTVRILHCLFYYIKNEDRAILKLFQI